MRAKPPNEEDGKNKPLVAKIAQGIILAFGVVAAGAIAPNQNYDTRTNQTNPWLLYTLPARRTGKYYHQGKWRTTQGQVVAIGWGCFWKERSALRSSASLSRLFNQPWENSTHPIAALRHCMEDVTTEDELIKVWLEAENRDAYHPYQSGHWVSEIMEWLLGRSTPNNKLAATCTFLGDALLRGGYPHLLYQNACQVRSLVRLKSAQPVWNNSVKISGHTIVDTCLNWG